TLLNEFRIGFSAVDYNQQANTAGLSNIGEQIGIPGANTFSEGLPLLQFGDFSYGSNALLQIFHTTTGQLADNVILTHGRQTITLNFGLRFEDHVPYHEIQDREINFGVVDGSLKQASGGNALYDNYLGRGDWQPRIGVAWAPSALGGNTVIRAAYGISSYAEGGGANQLLTKNWPPAFASSIVQGGTLASGFGAPAAACSAPFTLSCFAGKA